MRVVEYARRRGRGVCVLGTSGAVWDKAVRSATGEHGKDVGDGARSPQAQSSPPAPPTMLPMMHRRPTAHAQRGLLIGFLLSFASAHFDLC